ncbi:GTP pyrophosphokinase [Bradyrhizobium zhanjiangense]|nr:RelA/SpoT domain-containing protein [Bradyrhizobium zhanjiangense]
MNELELVSRWEQEAPLYKKWGEFVVECITRELTPLLDDRTLDEFLKIPVLPRTKLTSSFVDKAFHRKKYANPYEVVEDKVGVRFVVLLTDDIKLVEKAIANCNFIISKDKDYEAERDLRPLEFAYQSVHFVVRSKVEISDQSVTFPAGMPCEVQIRTLLQHAHSELTHDRIYKGRAEPPPKTRRTVARSMALIETTDDFFTQVVRDLDELDRPTREIWNALARVYRDRVNQSVERAKSNVLLIDAIQSICGTDVGGRADALLAEKPFIADRIRGHASTNSLFRQPAILLAYLGAYESPASLKAKWPLQEEDLRPVFIDAGRNLDDY